MGHGIPNISPPTRPCQTLCSVSEFDELPVRHNEDKLNAAMSRTVRFPVDARTCDDPHTKANLLLQVRARRGRRRR